jgi:hypothetical protein
MTFKEKAQDIYRMMGEGKLLDAFDKYYAENVVMQEVGEAVREGKAINRAYEERFLASVEGFHGMGIDAIASDEENGVVFIENWMDATLAGVGRITLRQVCVQRWEGDHIVKELFYHK